MRHHVAIMFGLLGFTAAALGQVVHIPSFVIPGNSADEYFGASVSGAGDVNGDGVDDFIVGSPRDGDNGTNSGSARVFSGLNGAVLYTFLGDSENDQFGTAVSGAGDVNNDGFADLIVGAPYDDNNGGSSGSARVFSGIDGSILYTLDGPSSNTELGSSVSGAGDIDGDGFDDLIVGSPRESTSSGRARVISGFDGSAIYTFAGDSSFDRFGHSVGSAGDVNNDGIPDIVVGSPEANSGSTGLARVFSGADGSVLYTFEGGNSGDNLGESVSCAGDVNNDGFDDVIVGTSSGQNGDGVRTGYARVFSGIDGAVLHTFFGDLNSDRFGVSVSGPGDVNGDGIDDLLIGAHHADNLEGRLSGIARVFSGYDGAVLYTFSSDNNGDEFGIAVSGIGDINHDGLAEMVVGATGDDDNGGRSGSVRIYYSVGAPALSGCAGDATGDDSVNFADLNLVLSAFGVPCPDDQGLVSHTPAYPVFVGDSDYGAFGRSVSGAGDVDGDGFHDIIVGARADDNNGDNSGSASVFSGASGAVLYTFDGNAPGDQFGNSVSGAGDVNNDGYDDLIAGSPYAENAGSARVFSGIDGSVLYTFDGDSAGDDFGIAVSGAGDVNGDGFDDVIVGAPSNSDNGNNSGSARVLSGADGSTLYTFFGDTFNDEFGRAVSGAGDVNNDGFADVIVGAWQDDNNGDNSGSARVFSGADGSILYTFDGDSAADSLGIAVGAAGDVNGDGFDDLIVGANGDDNNGNASGSARVFSGVDGSILYTFNGDSAEDWFGCSVSGAGDVNGDGFDDLIVGAFFDDNAGESSGSARVFSGIDGSILYTLNGDSAEDWFGFSVSGAGDVNDDGFADFVVGAWLDFPNHQPLGSARLYVSVTVPSLPCPGDLTGDNIVNFADLNIVLSNFGAPCPE